MESFELYVLDKEFRRICLVDTFESFIWTERYGSCGDFELYVSTSSDVMNYAAHGNYIYIKESERLMIVETTEITTDIENGSHLKLTGRSLESILARRIIWKQTTVEGNVEAVIKKLITDAIISPSDSARRIENFIFVDSNDSYIADCEIEKVQYLGDNLYDVIVDILSLFSIGFKITYNFSTGNFEFRLYNGIDRTYNQMINPWVLFSPENENLISSDYIEDSSAAKNVNLVAGEDPDQEASDPKKFFVYVYDSETEPSGLTRCEMFTDGGEKKQKYKDEETEEEITLTDAEYQAVLREYGLENLFLKENRKTTSFDAEMNAVRGFKYGQDFLLGDIVQIKNEYGIYGTARVSELIMSQDTSGISMYPTFESLTSQ